MEGKPDEENGPGGEQAENGHKTVIIILTVVMVGMPLVLGALRLLGYI